MAGPRVALISDEHGWAFDRNSTDWAECVPGFRYQILYVQDPTGRRVYQSWPDLASFDAVFTPHVRWPWLASLLPWDRALGALRTEWFRPEAPGAATPEDVSLANRFRAFAFANQRSYERSRDRCPAAVYLTNPVNPKRFGDPTRLTGRIVASWAGNAIHRSGPDSDVKGLQAVILPALDKADVPCLRAEYRTSRLAPHKMPEFYRRANVTLSASLYEGASNNVMEAMLMGHAIVATDVGNHRELLMSEREHFAGETGIIIVPRSAAAFADVLRMLDGDPLRVARMGEINREEILARWSWPAWEARYRAFLEMAVNRAVADPVAAIARESAAPSIRPGSGTAPLVGAPVPHVEPVRVASRHVARRPRVLLAIDRFGWAFHNIAKALIRHLPEYEFTVRPYTEVGGGEYELVVAFWWRSLPGILRNVRAASSLICLYDDYSWRRFAEEFRSVTNRADAIGVANRRLASSVAATVHRDVAVIEDGVDTKLFVPGPLPDTFTVGWTGSSDGPRRGGSPIGDHKGLAMIESACERLDLPLRVLDASADGWEPVPHEEMPLWYQGISVLVCASASEGTPNTALEAMACGRPVISTNVGIVDQVLTPDCGRIVERSSAAIEGALRDMRLLPPRALREMGLAASERVVAWDWSTKVAAWGHALATAMSARPADGIAPRRDLSGRVTAFALTTGEPSTETCLGHLRAQDVVVGIETIANITPMDRAFQQMLDRCKTELFVQVDADMLLDAHAIGSLVDALDASTPDTALYVGWLWGDAEEQPIQGVKVYRHALARGYPYEGSLSCEMTQVARMARDGVRVASAPCPRDRAGCFGEHRVLQTPEMAFHRWLRLAEKYRRLTHMRWVGKQLPRLRERFLQYHAWGQMAQAAVWESAWLGAVTGLGTTIMDGKESNALGPHDEWRRMLPVLGDWSDGPREASLFVTERCNARCGFCRREFDVALDGKRDMQPELVARVLQTLPTLRAACLAGFGEPLLNGRLPEIVRLCRERSLFVSVITNGFLLAERANDLAAAGVSRVTVSLNAASREEHERIFRVPTWEWVLDGVRAVVAHGCEVAASFVITRHNAHTIPAMLALGQRLGVRSIDLPNLLPHGGVDEPSFAAGVLRVDSPEMELVSAAKQASGAELVGHWPVPIGGECPRRCDSPFMSIGIDAEGRITGCRRVLPPQTGHGLFSQPDAWRSAHYTDLRRALTGDAPLPDMCTGCFGAWSR